MMTQPSIPMGGFLIIKNSSKDLAEITNRLNGSGAKTISFSHSQVVLAAWNEFPGQGLWTDENGAVAYDVDLTNEAELWQLIGTPEKPFADIGLLIWKLYLKFGIDFIDRLRGAFAFAIWDNKKNELMVVTDFYGIRPVVYATHLNCFVAASRIRQLLLVPEVSRDIDPEAIYHYLFFQAVCSPVTIYKSIRKLEPGKGLRWFKKEIRPFTHYDIRYQPENRIGEAHWVREIPCRIEEAVRRYALVSEPEKTGCFLSGGTDSSSVVGYFTKITGKPVKTFSIGFDDPKYNELDYARIAVRRFGAKQHEYLVTPEDVINLVDKLPQIYDEPFGNASVVPAFYCAKTAGEAGVNMLLGGDGGDEIFGGNERYVKNLVFENYFMLPNSIRQNLLEPFLNRMPGKGVFQKAKNYVKRSTLRNPRRFFSYNLLEEIGAEAVFRPDFLEGFNPDCFMALAQEHYNRVAPSHDTDRLLYIDMKFTITDNDLRKVTQMVEAAGLQVRYPLLDRDLVDFTTTIPPTLKVKWGKNRYIFKRAMKGFLPDEIISKSKHGMGMPISKWFKTDPKLAELMRDTLFSKSSKIRAFVKMEFLDEIERAFKSDDSAYYGDNLWVLLLLESWLEKNM
ncbi:MAG: asparagine synthase-related protein [Desulfobacterales bacterium]|jgi:asparagine synthase (glutamine-hydrolysing)|nr:asparagine synthase-related protein [Desulfobacterales bacterium]